MYEPPTAELVAAAEEAAPPPVSQSLLARKGEAVPAFDPIVHRDIAASHAYITPANELVQRRARMRHIPNPHTPAQHIAEKPARSIREKAEATIARMEQARLRDPIANATAAIRRGRIVPRPNTPTSPSPIAQSNPTFARPNPEVRVAVPIRVATLMQLRGFAKMRGLSCKQLVRAILEQFAAHQHAKLALGRAASDEQDSIASARS